MPFLSPPEVTYINDTIYSDDPDYRKYILEVVKRCWKVRNSGGKKAEIR